MKDYNLIFVGAGPSTIMAVYKLIKENYQGEILIIEKGKSLTLRQPSEVINGFAGAGAFSDGKLSSALDIGGTIPGLTENKLKKYNKILLEMLNSFNEDELLKWKKSKDFDTTPSNLKWSSSSVCHMGTDRAKKIFLKIEDYFKEQPNIKILFETQATNVYHLSNNQYQVEITDLNTNQKSIYLTNKLIMATGQKDTLISRMIKENNIKSVPRAFQLGVRVVDIINPQYENILKANYDFKFVKNYTYPNGINIRIRTFCCNSGNAHVCAENVNNEFICFNGHAFKQPDSNNHTVNYGIICEVEGLNKYNTKEEQIELMKLINKIPGWEQDNFIPGQTEPSPSRYLLNGFPQLKNYYPDEIINSLNDFVKELNKIVDLSKAKYLYPETKLSGLQVELNPETFETKVPNLYMIGDASITRGILKSSYTGYKTAENIINEV